MKNIKHQMIIDTLLKLAVIIALIVAVSTKQHYSFYNFLRWLITAAFTVSTYIIVQRHCEEEARRRSKPACWFASYLLKLIKLMKQSPPCRSSRVSFQHPLIKYYQQIYCWNWLWWHFPYSFLQVNTLKTL